MRHTTQILAFFMLTLLGAGCSDHLPDPNPATATCRLTEINGAFIDGLKSTFEYDANGRVSRQIRDFGDVAFDYKHTYDASGRLSESIITDLDSAGKKTDEALEKYVWTNGRITQFQWAYQSGFKGVNNLTYDAQGRLIGFTTENDDSPADNTKWAYTYDDNGVVTRRLLTSFDGTSVIFEARLTYTTKEIVKTAFSLMPKAGLPVDLILARPWESNYPKNDGVLSYYLADADGKLELLAKGTIQNMTFNQSGIATGWSYGDVTGDLTPVTFQITGCP
jgi:YD repeat-containing protein